MNNSEPICKIEDVDFITSNYLEEVEIILLDGSKLFAYEIKFVDGYIYEL